MDIVTDYGNWKFENYDLLDKLVKLKSDIIRRFPHVILVCDYFYDKVTNEAYELSRDEEVIFQTAFNYLFDHFSTLNLLLEKDFNNNIESLNKLSKTINLLLYVNDFQTELENNNPNDITSIKQLSDFEARVLNYISSHTNAPDEMFGLLSDITSNIFDASYMGVNEILYEVSEELGIAPDEDDKDDYNFKY